MVGHHPAGGERQMFDCTPQILIMCRDSIRRGAHYMPAALWVGDGVRYPARRVCGTMPSIVPYRLFVGLQHITKCSVGNGLDRSGTLSYMAQRDLWQSLSGGQRALCPQARFGGQPPQAAFGPEMAALPRNCQQMRNIFLRPSGLDRERRPLQMGQCIS